MKSNLFVLVICLSIVPLAAAQTEPPDLRVMSFNIRYGTANDGSNHWRNRKEIVAQIIKDVNPDIVGTQETLDIQASFLRQQLPEYLYVGRSRQQDPDTGEQCGIFFRKSRFAKLIEGHFWLSETPDKPGSKSWDSSLPRMATWLKLWDRDAGYSFYIINTHFDHRGKTARDEAAKLIRQFAINLPDAKFLIVTGDFNAAESSPPYHALFHRDVDQKINLWDTYRQHVPRPSNNEGTFGGFKGTRDGSRIDWIASSDWYVVKRASIIRKSYDGKYPSDHYPVTALLSPKKTGQ